MKQFIKNSAYFFFKFKEQSTIRIRLNELMNFIEKELGK